MGGMKAKDGSGNLSHQNVKVTCVRVDGLGVCLSAKGAGKLPRRMKVLGWGENPNSHGRRIFVGGKLAAALSAPLYPWRKVALDFEHNTVPGTPAYSESREPRDVAGFCDVECVAGDGVYIVMAGWTSVGAEKAEMYADLSAAVALDGSGEVTGVKSVALCKCGAVEGMDFAEAQVPLSADVASLFAETNKKDDTMDYKKMLCERLGLDAATATDKDIEQASLTQAAAKSAANVGGGDTAALSAQVEAAVKPLADQVKAVQGEMEKVRKDSVLALARMQGKVVALSAEAVGKLSIEDLQKHVDGLAATVPLSAHTPAKVDDGGSGGGVITEQQRRIAENCGVDPEAVFGKKK